MAWIAACKVFFHLRIPIPPERMEILCNLVGALVGRQNLHQASDAPHGYCWRFWNSEQELAFQTELRCAILSVEKMNLPTIFQS